MAPTKILIIHGYSDCSESFRELKEFLIARQLAAVETVYYADYESREDSLSFNDVADGLHDQLIRQEIIRNDGSSDCNLKIIVHSTGGLVVRHWLWRYYQSCSNMGCCPVRNIVMLAPANFGSPLAHRGRSFLGSLVKGRWAVGDFLEVGKELLFGLELGSPYQWRLAHRDLLTADHGFQPDKIKVTVLVGDEDYKGLKGWVNKPGTDGTVVIAGTNLNTVKLTLGFEKRDGSFSVGKAYRWSTNTAVSHIAFGVLRGYDHGSIVSEAAHPDGSALHPGALICQALTDDVNSFQELCQTLAAHTESVYETNGKDRYQQFIVHAIDDHEEPVADFTMEFFVYPRHVMDSERTVRPAAVQEYHERYSREIEDIITCEMHQHTLDRSFRRFLINHRALDRFLRTLKADPALPAGFVISMSVHVPPVEKGIEYELSDLRNIVIYDSGAVASPDVPNLFYPNTTTLLELSLDRNNGYVYVGQEPRVG